jgi:hypothetical protein
MIEVANARRITLIVLIVGTVGALLVAFNLIGVAMISLTAVFLAQCAVVQGLGLIGGLSPVILLVVIALVWWAWLTRSRRKAVAAAIVLAVPAALAAALTAAVFLLPPTTC